MLCLRILCFLKCPILIICEFFFLIAIYWPFSMLMFLIPCACNFQNLHCMSPRVVSMKWMWLTLWMLSGPLIGSSVHLKHHVKGTWYSRKGTSPSACFTMLGLWMLLLKMWARMPAPYVMLRALNWQAVLFN